MKEQLKTILLTVLTLSMFTIALVELTGISSTALFNKYHIGQGGSTDQGAGLSMKESDARVNAASGMAKTELQFIDTKFSFGKIKEGDVVKHAYHFKNAGKEPLLISRAEASCGCTVPSFPKEPIPPGGEGDIVVQFDSHNKKGHQQKNVLVWSNSRLEKMSIGFDADVE